MSTHENAPPLDGWAIPPRLHCGEWHEAIDCPTCRETLPPLVPSNIELGTE